MKTTRRIFALTGKQEDVQQALNAINFKGVRVFTNPCITTAEALDTFLDNKSVVCQYCSTIQNECPIVVNVVKSTETFKFQCSGNYIDIFDITTVKDQFLRIACSNFCDIGDHKSNSSGLNGAPKISECNYCNFFYKGIDTISQEILYESDHFFVMTTLGEFINGYLLIIPKKHVMSCAELDEKAMKDFLEVLDDILYILRITYKTKKFLVWENGTGNGGVGKAKDSIVHSHVHVAPSSLTAKKIQLESGIPLKKISANEISNYTAHSYLLIKTKNGWRINDDQSVYIPRQYVRQLIAEEYNLTEEDIWNWRTHPFVEKMHETYNQIKSALAQNWEFVPERIKERLV